MVVGVCPAEEFYIAVGVEIADGKGTEREQPGLWSLRPFQGAVGVDGAELAPPGVEQNLRDAVAVEVRHGGGLGKDVRSNRLPAPVLRTGGAVEGAQVGAEVPLRDDDDVRDVAAVDDPVAVVVGELRHERRHEHLVHEARIVAPVPLDERLTVREGADVGAVEETRGDVVALVELRDDIDAVDDGENRAVAEGDLGRGRNR